MSLKIQGSLFKDLCKRRRVLLRSSNLYALNSYRGVSSYQDIPRAPRIPVVGSMPYLFKAGGQKYLHKYVDQHHKTLGPIFIDNLGGGDLLFLSDPVANNEAYHSEGDYPEHLTVDIWNLYLQETGRKRGLFFMDGEEWSKTRKVFNVQILGPESMTNFVQRTSEVCKDFMNAWIVNPPTNLEFQLYCWNVECVADILVGKRLGFLDKLKHKEASNEKYFQEDEFVQALYAIFLETAKLYGLPAKLVKNLRLGAWKRFYAATTTALDYGEAIVQQSINDCKNNATDRIKQSILYRILQAKSIPEDVLKHVLTDFFLASTDTTAHTATWILYLLGKHPEVAEITRKEIFSVLEKEELTLNAIKRMKYVNGVIREAMRLYPVASFLTRKLEEPTDLCGYSVPKGTMVISSLFSMGRDPNNFLEPNEFRPDRWFDLREKKKSKEYGNQAKLAQKYVPWGLGKRTCVGRRIAELELSLLVIESLKAFEWTIEEDVDMVLRMVSVPSKDVKLKLRPL